MRGIDPSGDGALRGRLDEGVGAADQHLLCRLLQRSRGWPRLRLALSMRILGPFRGGVLRHHVVRDLLV